jgi:hypothetical protein
MGWGKLYAVCTKASFSQGIPIANHSISVSVSGTELAKWDKNTWGPLADLAANHPEAGVHFQGRNWSGFIFLPQQRMISKGRM